MSGRRTWYMHTLDGKPAALQNYRGVYLVFVGGRFAATLVPSLRQIRREQQQCLSTEWREWLAKKDEFRGERPSSKRYGYVLVASPSSSSEKTS